MKKQTKALVRGAVIAALYAALTLVAAAFAFTAEQFRFSEALTILPVFTPAAIPGLTLGCFLANLGSPYPLDMIFGTAASLLSAICTYLLRNVRFKNIPWLAPLPPVLFNAVAVGLMITISAGEGFMWPVAFLSNALMVGISQFIVCYGLGLPFFLLIEKTGIKKAIFE